MNVVELVRAIYLGDCGCERITIDLMNETVAIMASGVTVIGEPKAEGWDFLKDAIQGGSIVFTGVVSLAFSPPGWLPNDYILSLTVLPIGEELYQFSLQVGAVKQSNLAAPGYIGETVTITIVASGIHIEDPNGPGVQITE
jgi:hypothetical protein